MRIGSRAGHLVLASVFALAPVLAVADKAQPKAGRKPPTEAELKKIVAKPINPVAAVAVQRSGTQKLSPMADWKVQTEGSPMPYEAYGESLKVQFRVTNAGPTPLPQTTLKYTCAVGLWMQPLKKVPCQVDASDVVPALQPGAYKILDGSAWKVGHSSRFGSVVVSSKTTAAVVVNNSVEEASIYNNSAAWSWSIWD